MSMKKFTKKMLAIVAAGAMTMGMAMPAMAADQTTTDTKNNAKEAYISKTYKEGNTNGVYSKGLA